MGFSKPLVCQNPSYDVRYALTNWTWFVQHCIKGFDLTGQLFVDLRLIVSKLQNRVKRFIITPSSLDFSKV